MTHLAMFHTSPAYPAVKIYNHLPANIKDLAYDIKRFKKALKNYLHEHSFYTVNEFFMYKTRSVFLMVILTSLHQYLQCTIIFCA
jgi:hypothetical protein